MPDTGNAKDCHPLKFFDFLFTIKNVTWRAAFNLRHTSLNMADLFRKRSPTDLS